MRVLLDECVDCRLAREFTTVSIATVEQMGWKGLKNGRLLTEAEQSFDVFLTVDQNLQYQQNLGKFDIAIVLMVARSNRLADLLPLVPGVVAALASAKPGLITVVA